MDKIKLLQAPLSADEMDFRVQSINNGGYATILVYKDARVDMNRLNEALGVGFWQRKHERVGNVMYCSVGIWNNDIKQFTWVQDAGVPSSSEAEKGEASDSFKRACFNLGIGIGLYDFPVISIKLNQDEWKKGEGNQRPKQTWSLKLKEWKWAVVYNEDGSLKGLAAKDQNGQLRYKFGEFN